MEKERLRLISDINHCIQTDSEDYRYISIGKAPEPVKAYLKGIQCALRLIDDPDEKMRLIADISHYLLTEEKGTGFYDKIPGWHMRDCLEEMKKILYSGKEMVIVWKELNVPIDGNVSKRIRNICVCELRLDTMHDIFSTKRTEIAKCRNLGLKCLTELDTWFKEKGFNWATQEKIEGGGN